MPVPGDNHNPGLDHSYAAVSAPPSSGDSAVLTLSHPCDSDEPSPSPSANSSREAIADLVRSDSLPNL